MSEIETMNEQIQAELHWIHVFKDMVFSGDVAKMGPYAVTVYLVIKTFSSVGGGPAFPSVGTIAEKAGISEVQVKRQLKILEGNGYISKERVGRNNAYRIREKVQIRDDSGATTAIATWDYVPAGVREAVSEIKRLLVTGELQGAKVVHIENLQVNISHGNEMVVNNQGPLPPDLAEKIEALREAYLKKKKDQPH